MRFIPPPNNFGGCIVVGKPSPFGKRKSDKRKRLDDGIRDSDSKGGIAMKRTIQFFHDIRSAKDFSGLTLSVAITASALVTISILFSQAMTDAALKRFHLASDSYPVWALQQCVPRMYNFENKIWFAASIKDLTAAEGKSDGMYEATLNHFPARHITYGDLRTRQFRQSDSAIFKMKSSFRGRHLTSIWEIKKDGSGVLRIQRVSETLASDGEEK
jgi:hypothetical protein